MVAVSHFAMNRCLSLQEGTMVLGPSQVTLATGSLLCVPSLGPADCMSEPRLPPCSLQLPGLQVGGSQNRHFQEVCKEQRAWGCGEECRDLGARSPASFPCCHR